MKRVYDITDKLTFAEPPVLKVKDLELPIDDSAPTALKIMSIVGNGDEMATKDIIECAELLFGKDGVKKLDKLKLSLADYITIIMEASNLMVGGDDTGEA